MIESKVDILLYFGQGDPQFRESYINYIKWFYEKNQDYWLFSSENYNYDNGNLVPLFMVTDDRCDRAVAKQIFRLCDADWYWGREEFWEPSHRPDQDLTMLLEIVRLENLGLYPESHRGPTYSCPDWDFRQGLQPPAQIAPSAPPMPVYFATPYIDPYDPVISAEDHPTNNKEAAAIFSAIGSGF